MEREASKINWVWDFDGKGLTVGHNIRRLFIIPILGAAKREPSGQDVPSLNVA